MANVVVAAVRSVITYLAALAYIAVAGSLGLIFASVFRWKRGLYVLATELGDVTAQLSGRFVYEAEAGMHPVAGDWVAVVIRPDEAAAGWSRGRRNVTACSFLTVTSL